MLKLSAETASGSVVSGVSSCCIPNYYGSGISPLAVAKKLSKHCKDITLTEVCRGFKTVAAVKKALAAAAALKEIKTILAVTGYKASGSDMSVFDMIKSIDKKRFKAAAAVVFTRKNEAQRIAKKAAAGARAFYTQPVFPSSSKRLVSMLKQLPPKLRCSIKIGVLIPFSAAACRRIAAEKPDFIPDKTLIGRIAAAERKGPEAAYRETVAIAEQGINIAAEIAEAINSRSQPSCRIAGIHLYGLTDRKFGSKNVPAGKLLSQILNTPKKP
jgi:5,10-methylenetetrahydrofolate reductase